MQLFSRAAATVALSSCLLGAAAMSAPSFATEAPVASATSATAMLAAVTGPLLAVDVHTLEQRTPGFSSQPDFSTGGQTSGQSSGSDLRASDAPLADARPEALEDLVADHTDDTIDDDEARCLAASVYYESKGEPLTGQLAVAQTIINRTHSGRFPASVCGVVRQHGQFSFFRGGDMPQPDRANQAWKTAVAIATIARQGLWKQIAPEALYFHARRVSPGWGKIRVASLGNHIFFR